jgi:hypothetical protein
MFKGAMPFALHFMKRTFEDTLITDVSQISDTKYVFVMKTCYNILTDSFKEFFGENYKEEYPPSTFEDAKNILFTFFDGDEAYQRLLKIVYDKFDDHFKEKYRAKNPHWTC